ncbi:15504_t:CDS:2 [Racocetra persica]|uniref:15504_t:CDS:1 n=1 Tax=Racocetra persica TaxID=160502 RepID=A0ACA9M9B9_9GLOM|nr:15504_t:CDS:2 [Racocetra persica]
MLKHLTLLIFIIAILCSLTYATTPKIPLQWRRDELFGAFQDDAYYIGTFSNQSSLVERDIVTCQPGYYQCPGSSLCCSLQCGIICDNIGCCPSGYGCCGQYCCETGYSCCGKYCCKSGYYCCSDKIGCCALGYKCASSGLCSKPIISTTITQITQEVVEYVVRYIRVKQWATKNGYTDKEVEQLEKTAEKLVKCINNIGISFAKSNATNNSSCISCEHMKSLSNLDIDLPPTNDEIIATLKLLYSIGEDIKDASKCKFNLACVNGTDSCPQNSKLKSSNNLPSLGCISNPVNSSLMAIGLILYIIMSLGIFYI